ncbi:MAG: hypothetical protein JSS81_15915 [Acidobacteria bacterium]|nr:hypothetical protein [Acidobacteriota bacterium]
MKRFFLLILFLLTLSVAGATAQTKSGAALPVGLVRMTEADSAELLKDPVIKKRLRKLLGRKNYAAFLESFETVTPVEKKGSFLFSSGCLIHACRHLESAIAVDLVNQTIHAAIYRQTERTRFFNENRRKTPRVIRRWAKNLPRPRV